MATEYSIVQEHITPHVIGHLYKALHDISGKLHCVEYPLRAIYDDDGGGDDGDETSSPSSTTTTLDQPPHLVFEETRRPTNLMENSRPVDARVFRHLDGSDTQFIVLPAEQPLGKGAYGTVYSVDVLIQRKDKQGYYFFPMVMKIEKTIASEPEFESSSGAPVGNMFPMVPDTVPETLPQLLDYVQTSQEYDPISVGPRSLPVKEYRYQCSNWYLEPIAMHAIQQSPTLPPQVKAMTPRIYASLAVKDGHQITSILLMERFTDMITLYDYLTNNEHIDIPKALAQIVGHMAMIHMCMDGSHFDLHSKNILIDPITHRLVVLDLAMMAFTFQGIRFETWQARQTANEKVHDALLFAQNRLNLKWLCDAGHISSTIRMYPEWSKISQFILPFISNNSRTSRASVLERAYDLLLRFYPDIEPLQYMPPAKSHILHVALTDSLAIPITTPFVAGCMLYDVVEIEVDSVARWLQVKEFLKFFLLATTIEIIPRASNREGDGEFQLGGKYPLHVIGLQEPKRIKVRRTANLNVMVFG